MDIGRVLTTGRRLLAGCGVSGMLGGAPLLHAQSGEQPIAGVVRDSTQGFPIIGVQVTLEGTRDRTQTDARGAFRFASGPGGVVRVNLRRLGFRPRTVEVEGGSAMELWLASVATPLPPVVVRAERGHFTGRLGGFYERLERRTQGIFITRADLEREQPPQLTDMLQRVPGLRVTGGRPGAQGLRMRGRDCRPLVWIDGAALSAADVDLDSFSPSSLEGIELYLSATSTPSRFQAARGQSECGTVLLWTRDEDTGPRAASQGVTPAQFEEAIASRLVFTAEEVDTPAVMRTDSMVAVPYPPSLRASHTSGLVLVEFVVDTAGRVEVESLGTVSSTDRLFSEAVRAALPGASFAPATRGGRPVRQLVRQPFAFRVPDQPESRR